METINIQTGLEHRINYRRLRITKLLDLRKTGRLLVEAYFRIGHGQKICLRGYIPYSTIAKQNDIDAVYLVDNIIMKLPVGIPSSKLSVFERNLLNAVCRTLVMANPALMVNDARTASPSVKVLLERITEAGYKDIRIPLDEIAKIVGSDSASVEADLLLSHPLVTIDDEGGIRMVSASAELVAQFYTVADEARNAGTSDEAEDPEGTSEDDGDDRNPVSWNNEAGNGFGTEIPEPPEDLHKNYELPTSTDAQPQSCSHTCDKCSVAFAKADEN